MRELGLGLGTVEHHLHVLERHGLLRSHTFGARRRAFFVSDSGPPPDPELWMALRTESIRRILQMLLDDADIAPSQIASRLGLSPPTVSYHLQRLVGWGILQELRIGRSRMHQLADPPRVRSILATVASTERPSASADETATGVLQYLLERIPKAERREVEPREEQRTIQR